MKKLLSITLLSSSLFAIDGHEVFKNKCSSCHVENISKKEFLSTLDKRKAPPMIEVANRLKDRIKVYNNDEDIHRGVVVAFIKDYVEYPDIMKGLCNSMAMARFGEMPSQKGNLSPEELQAVSEWVYDFYEGKEFK